MALPPGTRHPTAVPTSVTWRICADLGAISWSAALGAPDAADYWCSLDTAIDPKIDLLSIDLMCRVTVAALYMLVRERLTFVRHLLAIHIIPLAKPRSSATLLKIQCGHATLPEPRSLHSLKPRTGDPPLRQPQPPLYRTRISPLSCRPRNTPKTPCSVVAC